MSGSKSGEEALTTRRFARVNAVNPTTDVYLVRKADDDLRGRVADPARTITFVQGSRMSGKSSLVLALADERAREGQPVISVDLATTSRTGGVEEVFDLILDQLEEHEPVVQTSRPRNRLAALDQAITSAVGRAGNLAPGHDRLLLVVDELDALAGREDGLAILSLLRDLSTLGRYHENSALHLVLVGVRPPTHLVADSGAVANIMTGDDVLWLDDFPADATSQALLVAGFPPEMQEAAPTLAWKALEFSGGYPQACIWLCSALRQQGMDAALRDLQSRVERLVDEAVKGPQPPLFMSYPGNYITGYALGPQTSADPDPRRTALEALWRYYELLRGVRPGRFDPSATADQLLRWAGLARCDPEGVLRVRSPLVGRIFNTGWSQKLREDIQAIGAVAPSTQRVRSKSLPRVCLINAGGTIGMLPDEKQQVTASTAEEWLDTYDDIREVADIEYLKVLKEPLDSANVTPDHWTRLSTAIAEQLDRRDIDGIVVAHGTDTLTFTASAVAFALGEHLDRPVVFTGSQTTVRDVHGDARSNMVRACLVAGEGGRRLPEVVIVFDDKVLRACRAEKVDNKRFDAFASLSWPVLAVVTHELDIRQDAVRPIPAEVQPIEVRPDFDDRILNIDFRPKRQTIMHERLLDDEASEVRAVMIQSLGAGSLPTTGPASLIEFIEYAVDRDIPVVLGSRYAVDIDEPEKFEPSLKPLRAGAIPLFNMTDAAMYTKLAWLLGQMPPSQPGRSRIDWLSRRILKSYVGELDPSGLEVIYRKYDADRRGERPASDSHERE